MYALKQVIVCHSVASKAFVLRKTVVAPLGHRKSRDTGAAGGDLLCLVN